MPTLSPEAVSDLETLACTFRALGDPARLKILACLAQQDAPCCLPEEGVCACDLEEVTGLSQPTVSHHMKCLVSAELVAGEKRGRWTYYRLEPGGLATPRALLAALAPLP